eukprot:1481943-Rhodomonas_salina.1
MLPNTYIDPQTTVPGDLVSVRCEGQGQYVAVPLAPIDLPTQCDCDLCKDIRQTAAIHRHNEYQEAKRAAVFADNERVRAIHAAEREAAVSNVDSKKRSRQDEVTAMDLAERQARARLAAAQYPSPAGTAASGEIGDKGKTLCCAEQKLGGNVLGVAVVGGSDGTGNAPRRALQGTPTGGSSRGAPSGRSRAARDGGGGPSGG